jgi:hypothetical protein
VPESAMQMARSHRSLVREQKRKSMCRRRPLGTKGSINWSVPFRKARSGKNASKAASPPAEAPMPTMGKPEAALSASAGASADLAPRVPARAALRPSLAYGRRRSGWRPDELAPEPRDRPEGAARAPGPASSMTPVSQEPKWLTGDNWFNVLDTAGRIRGTSELS